MAAVSSILEKSVNALYALPANLSDDREVNAIYRDIGRLEKSDPAATAGYDGTIYTVPMALSLALNKRGWARYYKLENEVEVLQAQYDAAVDKEAKSKLQSKIKSAYFVESLSIIGDWNKSLKNFETADVHETLARLYYRLNKHGKKALEHVNRAVELDPKDSEIQETHEKIAKWANAFKGSLKLLIGLSVVGLLGLITGIAQGKFEVIFTGVFFILLSVGYFFWKNNKFAVFGGEWHGFQL